MKIHENELEIRDLNINIFLSAFGCEDASSTIGSYFLPQWLNSPLPPLVKMWAMTYSFHPRMSVDTLFSLLAIISLFLPPKYNLPTVQGIKEAHVDNSYPSSDSLTSLTILRDPSFPCHGCESGSRANVFISIMYSETEHSYLRTGRLNHFLSPKCADMNDEIAFSELTNDSKMIPVHI